MRLVVMFDIPVKTASERREATRFRNALVNDGFVMMQYSVYVRICRGVNNLNTHKNRVRGLVPDNGSVRMLTLTEKQFESMEIILGKFTEADEPFQAEQLTIF